jgi:hypothetical protein
MSIFVPQKGKIKAFSVAAVASMLALLVALSFSTKLAQADAPSAALTLNNTTLTLGVSPVVTGTGFTASEGVALWLTAPDQTVRFYGEGKADSAGNLVNYSYTPDPKVYTGYSQAQLATLQVNLPGQWALTAQGLTSGAVGIATFKALTPTVSATITNVSGNMVTLQLSGAFFYAYEPVGLWLTESSSGIVIPLSTLLTNNIGVFPDNDNVDGTNVTTLIFNSNGTTGPYMLTAYGNYSTQRVVIPVGTN